MSSVSGPTSVFLLPPFSPHPHPRSAAHTPGGPPAFADTRGSGALVPYLFLAPSPAPGTPQPAPRRGRGRICPLGVKSVARGDLEVLAFSSAQLVRLKDRRGKGSDSSRSLRSPWSRQGQRAAGPKKPFSHDLLESVQVCSGLRATVPSSLFSSQSLLMLP